MIPRTASGPRRAARTVLPAAAVAALLAGCEKPTPGVSVFSGTTSDRVAATCWSFEESQAAPEDCQVRGELIGSVPVTPGDTIGISVDPAIAETGWVPTIGDQRLVAEALDTTYYRFSLSEQDLARGPLELRVFATDGEAGEQTRGLWVFRLERR